MPNEQHQQGKKTASIHLVVKIFINSPKIRQIRRNPAKKTIIEWLFSQSDHYGLCAMALVAFKMPLNNHKSRTFRTV